MRPDLYGHVNGKEMFSAVSYIYIQRSLTVHALLFPQFYASWCSYSEEAMPHFKDVLQHVVDQNVTGIHLGKIEVTKNRGECISFVSVRFSEVDTFTAFL